MNRSIELPLPLHVELSIDIHVCIDMCAGFTPCVCDIRVKVVFYASCNEFRAPLRMLIKFY